MSTPFHLHERKTVKAKGYFYPATPTRCACHDTHLAVKVSNLGSAHAGSHGREVDLGTDVFVERRHERLAKPAGGASRQGRAASTPTNLYNTYDCEGNITPILRCESQEKKSRLRTQAN